MRLRSWRIAWWSEHHGIVLLVATTFLLLAQPLVDPYPYERAVLAPLFLLVVAAGISAIPGRGGRHVAWIAAPVAIAWLVARMAGMAVPIGHGAVLRLAPPLGLALILLVLVNLLRALAMAKRISAGVLAEAFTGYLLMAVAFAQLYATLNELLPGTFNTAPPRGAAMVYFVYFSLVTLAGIGFGDIVPIHPFVRVIAALEGVCGLFYTAVVIAKLVAAYTPRQMSSTVPNPGAAYDRNAANTSPHKESPIRGHE
jgi:ion channel